jgi:AraC-like DNA-binding protein
MSFLINDGYKKMTLDVASYERIDYWREQICHEFVQLDCEPLNKDRFHGEIRGGLNFGLLSVSEVQGEAQIVTRTKQQIAHSSEAYFLMSFQLFQQGVVKQNGREAILQPGSFTLYDSSEPYSLTFEKEFHQLIIQMPKHVLSRYLISPEKYTAVALSGNGGIGAVLSHFIFSLVKEYKELDAIHPELIENFLNMIAMAYSCSVMHNKLKKKALSKDALVERVLSYIENNYANHQLSNQHIADAHGISLRYLYKLFQKQEHTIHQIIQKRRLMMSRQLLQEDSKFDFSLDNLSYAVGFTSSSHFSRAFKDYFGECPRDFRQKIFLESQRDR